MYPRRINREKLPEFECIASKIFIQKNNSDVCVFKNCIKGNSKSYFENKRTEFMIFLLSMFLNPLVDYLLTF